MTDDRLLQRWGAVAGIVGPLLLAAYFAAPALAGWPYAGAAPDALAAYARSHATLFYAGGWLQATGALLSVGFFVSLVHLNPGRHWLGVAMVYVGGSTLVALVLVEAALLEAVPMAAADGDKITVATTFALSNGVFARIFPLAPAPLLFAGIGLGVRGTTLLPAPFASAAWAIAALFVVSGIAAIFGPPGLFLAIAMSIIEAVWILSAGVALAAKAWR